MRGTRVFAVIAVLFSMLWVGTVSSNATAQSKENEKSKKEKHDNQDEEKSKSQKDKAEKHDQDKAKNDRGKYKPKHISSAELDDWVAGAPPGWSKGKKVGWQGAGAPPGQSKSKNAGDKMYPPEARDWDKDKREDWDHKLEKSKTRIKDTTKKRGDVSEADQNSAVISVEAAARHGVPIKTAEETVTHAIKKDMKGEDIEKMTRAMAYGADKDIDQDSVGKFARKEIDSGKSGDELALAIYQEIDVRQQAQAEAPPKKAPWWKRMFGG